MARFLEFAALPVSYGIGLQSRRQCRELCAPFCPHAIRQAPKNEKQKNRKRSDPLRLPVRLVFGSHPFAAHRPRLWNSDRQVNGRLASTSAEHRNNPIFSRYSGPQEPHRSLWLGRLASRRRLAPYNRPEPSRESELSVAYDPP
jgi:hypothetical protein